MDGFSITECGSLACLSNPCRNGALCIEMDENEDEITTSIFNHNGGPYEDDIYSHRSTIENSGSGISSTSSSRKQPKIHDKWKCKCPTGYMGTICDISVCDDNPCQYGATCVTFPGSGYLCLCPFGKHGHYCEHSKYIYVYIPNISIYSQQHIILLQLNIRVTFFFFRLSVLQFFF